LSRMHFLCTCVMAKYTHSHITKPLAYLYASNDTTMGTTTRFFYSPSLNKTLFSPFCIATLLCSSEPLLYSIVVNIFKPKPKRSVDRRYGAWKIDVFNSHPFASKKDEFLIAGCLFVYCFVRFYR